MPERFGTSDKHSLSEQTIRALFRGHGIEVEPYPHSTRWRVRGIVAPPPLLISEDALQAEYRRGGPRSVQVLVARMADHVQAVRKLEALHA